MPKPTQAAGRAASPRPRARFELYSQTFLDHGYAPLPDFEEPQVGPVARPDLAARFPLILTSAKPTLFCQTQHRALPALRRLAPHRKSNCLNDDLDPRVVVGEHGWWQACAATGAPGYDPFGPQGANFNLLIGSAALDPISGTASHRAYLCDVRLTTPMEANFVGLRQPRRLRRIDEQKREPRGKTQTSHRSVTPVLREVDEPGLFGVFAHERYAPAMRPPLRSPVAYTRRRAL
jgi:hypothetical protein